MFCGECGLKIADGSTYCGGCGTPLSASQATTKPVVEKSTYEPFSSRYQKPGSVQSGNYSPEPARPQPHAQSRYSSPQPQYQSNYTQQQPTYQQPAYHQEPYGSGDYKNPTTASLLSIIPGLGFVYIGKPGQGFGYFLLTFFTYFFFVGLFVHIWVIWKSYKEAVLCNEENGYF